MVTQAQTRSIEDFDAFIQHPDYSSRDWEFIGGEIREVVSNNYSSMIASKFNYFIWSHIREKKLGGYVTGADGGYKFGTERYIPDVAYVSKQKQPQPSREAYNPHTPDLVVEVISDPNSAKEDRELRIKLATYLASQVVVWIISPDPQRVEVYYPGQTPQIIDSNGTVDGGQVLPGLSIAVQDIFMDADTD